MSSWRALLFSRHVSLCNPGCPGTHSVDQADLEFTYQDQLSLPLSASPPPPTGAELLKAGAVTGKLQVYVRKDHTLKEDNSLSFYKGLAA